MELRTLRQLEKQHRDLMRRRRSIELELSELTSLGEQGGEGEVVVVRATSLLTALRRELREHFALEEASGYLAAATDAAPRLSRRARRLAGEHANLAAALSRILDELFACQRSPKRWAGLVESFRRFSETLLAHERAEEEMVREAFMDDLGGGD